MQVICKIDRPRPTSYTPPITPRSSKDIRDLMHMITKLLQEGQESAQFIKTFFDGGLGFKVEGHKVDLDHHCLVALKSFKEALSYAKSIDFDDEDVSVKKRKLDHCNDDEGPCRGTVSKERRGCYKRRRTGEIWTKEVTELMDDGYGWRKYGQKEILNTKFPRNYYRCTHKYDQLCQATKQVQQISENPTKYTILYNGHHTCKYLNKISPIILETEQNSSYLLNFETNNYPTVKKDLNLSPTSTLLSTTTTPLTMVKQEYTSNKEEQIPISPSAPLDLDNISVTHSNHQYSSSSENLPTSSDITCSTPMSHKCNSYDFGYEYDEDDIFNLIDLDDYTKFKLYDIFE